MLLAADGNPSGGPQQAELAPPSASDEPSLQRRQQSNCLPAYATLCSIRFAERLSIRRVIPVKTMLMPTSVPITHSELEGHCRQTSTPRIRVTMPSNRIHPDPGMARASK